MPRNKKAIVDLRVRMREPLRASIAKAAKDRGVSLNKEAVSRLEASFRQEKSEEFLLGGKDVGTVLRLFGAAATLVEKRTGEKLLEDWRTSVAVRATWEKLMDQFLQEGPTKEASGDVSPPPELPPPPARPIFNSPGRLVSVNDWAEAVSNFENRIEEFEASRQTEFVAFANEWLIREKKWKSKTRQSEEIAQEVATDVVSNRKRDN